jgi:DNA polymerase III epsilon subunit-like protein
MDAVSLSLFLAVPAVGVWLGRPRIPEIPLRLQPFLPRRFVAVDVQSTGPDALRDDIACIAAVTVECDANRRDGWILERNGRPAAGLFCELLDVAAGERLVLFDAGRDMPFLERAAHYAERRFPNPVSSALDMAREAFPGCRNAELWRLARPQFDAAGMHPALARCELILGLYTAAAARMKRVE